MNILNSAKVGIVALAFLVILGSSAFAAFAPERDTSSWKKTSKDITFNSVKDNPAVGDERAFLVVRNFNNNNYADQLKVADNDIVVLRAYYHNNATADKIAKNTKIKINLPNLAAKNISATAYISSDNADPKIISDTTALKADKPFTLEYEKGSAQIWNNVLRGTALSDSIVSNTGASIGYAKLDGFIAGGSKHSGYVTIKAKVLLQKTFTSSINTNGTVPNTGPGEVAGLFAGATAVGTAVHLYVNSRRRR
jgi:hypothetical protein